MEATTYGVGGPTECVLKVVRHKVQTYMHTRMQAMRFSEYTRS